MEKELINDVPMETVSESWAKIVKEDEQYFLVDSDNTRSDALVLHKDGVYLILPKNSANRKWAAIKKVDNAIAESGEFLMTYKPTRTLVTGATGAKLPNSKLIAFLSEEDQAEYTAIVERAREAYTLAKNTPKSPLEKAKEKMERLQAAYEKLLAQDNEIEEVQE